MTAKGWRKRQIGEEMNPFSKDYKSGIDMSEVDKNNQRGKTLSKHVSKQRKKNPMFGTLYGIGEIVVDQTLEPKTTLVEGFGWHPTQKEPKERSAPKKTDAKFEEWKEKNT